jgi:hypothetical protein
MRRLFEVFEEGLGYLLFLIMEVLGGIIFL